MYEKLRNERIKQGVPVNELCELLGLSTLAAYYKKETGKINFTLTEAKIISERLNHTVEDIFFISGLSKNDNLIYKS